MRELWKPIYEVLSGDVSLRDLLKGTDENPKVVKGWQKKFPLLPYIVINLEDEGPFIEAYHEVIETTFVVTCLAGDEKDCERISERIIALLPGTDLTNLEVFCYWIIWDNIVFPLAFEAGRWRIDLSFRCTARKK